MADNVPFQTTELASLPNGFAPATDDVAGVHFQRVKLDIGSDGVSAPVLTTNPLPVQGQVNFDAPVAGAPLSMGVRADGALPTPVGNGDATWAWGDTRGAQIMAGRLVDDAAFTPASDRVHPIGYVADETSTDSVDEGDIGVARITHDRKQIVTVYAHALAGGHTPYKNLDVDETEDEIKATAGKLFWIHVMNLAATLRYLKFYNATAATVVVGTTVPVLTFPIPTLGDTNGTGFHLAFGDAGVQFTTAITVAATTGLADTDVGAPGANEVILNCGWL